MKTALARSPLGWRAWSRTLVRESPERWLFAVAGFGWLIVVVLALTWHANTGVGTATGGHLHGTGPTSHVAHESSNVTPAVWFAGIVGWAAMVAATMLPLVAPNARHVARRSPFARRRAATFDVVAGWTLIWLFASVILFVGTALLTAWLGSIAGLVLVFGVAALWPFTARHRRAVARCHRTFAPPLGDTAARTCRRFGTSLGVDCATSCFWLMAAMAVAGHRVVVMVPLAWVSWSERRLPHHRPNPRRSAAVICAVGAFALIATWADVSWIR